MRNDKLNFYAVELSNLNILTYCQLSNSYRLKLSGLKKEDLTKIKTQFHIWMN